MKNYIPDYTLCIDTRKEIHHQICKHCIKDTYMYCNLKNKVVCMAWKDYKHKGE